MTDARPIRRLLGRAADPERDHELTLAAVERVGETRTPLLRVWRPHRQVAFGRRDARAAGYERARRAARERGYPSVERSVGGRAVAYTGSTVAFVRATPVDDPRGGLDERYEAATRDLLGALARLGVDAERGEPPDSFCPGTHSLQARGKVAGLAQRVTGRVATVAGVVVVRDHRTIGAVLDPVYAALDVPFDPGSVGSLARAGGSDDPDAVVETLADTLAGDRTVFTESVGPGSEDRRTFHDT